MKKNIIQIALLLLFYFFSLFDWVAAAERQKNTGETTPTPQPMHLAQNDENPAPAPLTPAAENDKKPTPNPENNEKSTEKKKDDKKKKYFLAERPWVDDDEANDLLTPLERYSRRTKVNIFRRTEALFFISIPFSMLTQFTLKTSFSLFNAFAAVVEDGENPVHSVHFLYNHEKTIASSLDPFYVYTWTANILWPFVIAINDVIERTTTNAYTLRQKKNIRLLRFETDLMHTDF